MSQYLLLFSVGLVAGTLNVIAGGGSFLTIPLLIFMGLPPIVANGTNRVGILCQNITASWSFQRHGVVDWQYVRWATGPAVIGALLGSKIAIVIGDEIFKNILAVLYGKHGSQDKSQGSAEQADGQCFSDKQNRDSPAAVSQRAHDADLSAAFADIQEGQDADPD